MLRKIFHLFLLVGALAQFSIAQSADDEKERRIEKANKILKAARDVIYKGVKRKEINAIWIEKQITAVETKVLFEGASDPQGTKSRVIADEEVMASFPDRLKSVTIAYISETAPNDNFSKVELAVNGEEVEVKQLLVFNGKEFDMKELIKAEGASKEEIKKQIKKLEEIQSKMQTKEFVYQNLWISVFPVLLDLPWNDVETRFVYLGKAQVGNKPANVLEYVPTDKEKAKQKKYQAIGQASLFFDEKTRLLLMITAEVMSKKVKIKKTYFFSDYQEMDGLLVAKRINTEAITLNNRGVEMLGKKTVRGGSKTIQEKEIIIKSFKVNPAFKKGTFEVKRKNRAKKVRKKQ